MKLLILSDSHAGLGFMRRCVETVKPDQIIHLGDYYDDGQTLQQEYPHIPLLQVPGNCDRYRCFTGAPEVLCPQVAGVKLMLTHGHLHDVKRSLGVLLSDARRKRVQAVLYGHTHICQCRQEEDGLWVLNPGSCGSYGGSAGILQIENGSIVDCRCITQWDLEEMQ